MNPNTCTVDLPLAAQLLRQSTSPTGMEGRRLVEHSIRLYKIYTGKVVLRLLPYVRFRASIFGPARAYQNSTWVSGLKRGQDRQGIEDDTSHISVLLTNVHYWGESGLAWRLFS
jgi:hypothetical protein